MHDDFREQYMATGTPVVVRGLVKNWIAIKEWSVLSALQEKAGPGNVPIEMGDHYMQPGVTKQNYDFRYFLMYLQHHEHVAAELGNMYLAQHALFETFPHLAQDIEDPPLRKSAANPEERPMVNAWFGRPGQFSPLHFDPYHNMLCQVHGEKQVMLFPPSDTQYLYQFPEPQHSNTSQVIDPRGDAHESWPKLQHTSPQVTELQPGDVLYMPPKWWHFCSASLNNDFNSSVNFWWLSAPK